MVKQCAGCETIEGWGDRGVTRIRDGYAQDTVGYAHGYYLHPKTQQPRKFDA